MATGEDMNRFIENTIVRIKSIYDPKHGRLGTKHDMEEILGLIVLGYVVFAKFELEEIVTVINEALSGMCNDINGELVHVGKLVLENRVKGL